jgi:hypothetical protein
MTAFRCPAIAPSRVFKPDRPRKAAAVAVVQVLLLDDDANLTESGSDGLDARLRH